MSILFLIWCQYAYHHIHKQMGAINITHTFIITIQPLYIVWLPMCTIYVYIDQFLTL